MTSSDSGQQRVPARIDLEDFIEAVTRGVMRAMEAQGDTSGYIAPIGGNQLPGTIINRPPIIIGLVPFPPFNLPGGVAAAQTGQATLAR
jgi:hypothetical protein